MFSNDLELLDDFLQTSIAALDISYAEYQAAVDRYVELGEFLCSYWGATAGGVVYPQGSMLLGTVTRIIHRHDEYDLDAVCLRELAKESITQADLKSDVGHGLKLFVESDPMDHPELDDEGRRCWTLTYPGQSFHLDVLPALPDPKGAPQAIILTDKTVREWRYSNPIGFASWFNSMMATEREAKRAALSKRMNVEDVPEFDLKTTLQQAVQAFKRHRDIFFAENLDERPASIIITTLAGLAYTGGGNLYEVLRDLALKMPSFVTYANGMPTVANPVQPKENFADRWKDEPRRAELFFQWMAKVAEDFSGFGADRGLDRVIGKVASALGERPAEQASKSMGLGLFNTRQAGRLGMTTGTGILVAGSGRSTPRHNFRGD